MTFADIYNFFTHVAETVETLVGLVNIFILPSLLFLTLLVSLWFLKKLKIETYPLSFWIKYPTFLILIFINLNSTMALKTVSTILNYKYKKINSTEIKTPLHPIRDNNLNIILIIGESMRYDSFIEHKLKKLGFFYKKIYAGATNTDVSLPLLINNKTNPLKLTANNQTNLFRLAKKNNFYTAFISMQSKKALHYIKPYLQLEYIDYFKSYERDDLKPLYDLLLLKEFQKIDFLKKSFIVLEQIGQHSPYNYFSGKVSKNPTLNYKNSVEYSFKLYSKLYNYLKNLQKPYVLIYTSDHGEFSGENGKFGHNSFNPTIYEVPMFIVSNIYLPSSYKNISSHYQLSQFLIYLLGYNKEFKIIDEDIIINGTMLSREDGYIVIKNGSGETIHHFP